MIDLSQEQIIWNWKNYKENEPLVSISCITYNHVLYIEQCLDGMLMQKTNFPFEILIHDDCSTDGTTEIVRKYENKYPNIVKPMYEKENQWKTGKPIGSRAWNFPRAKGKYIAICEGDDYWTDEYKLQTQFDFFENNNDFALSCHNSFLISGNKQVGIFNKKNFHTELTASEIISKWCIPTASMMIRKEVINIIPVIEGLIQGDILIYLSAISIGRCHYDNKIMSAYRINNEKSASSAFSRDYLQYYKNMKKSLKKIDLAFNFYFHKPISKLLRRYSVYIVRFWFEKKIPCFKYAKLIIKKYIIKTV